MSVKSVAVDGPSGAGKSTMAKLLARALGFLYVDTGAIYRTLGLFARQNGVEPNDAAGVTALLPRAEIVLRHGGDGTQRMFLNGTDVTEAIRRHEISHYASEVSAIPAVRDYLLNMQRALAKEHNVIMDGRDIGTVVLPDADVKIFLTADPADRARRRYEELCARGEETDYQTVYGDLMERDRRDTTRAAAPLRRAPDALLVDTTGNCIERSFDVLLDTVKERLTCE